MKKMTFERKAMRLLMRMLMKMEAMKKRMKKKRRMRMMRVDVLAPGVARGRRMRLRVLEGR